MPTPTELQERAVEFAKTGSFGLPALEANLELTRVAPANEGAWTRLARCYLEAGRLEEATAALDAVLQVNSQNSIARSLQIEVTKRRMLATASVKPLPTRTPRAKAVRPERAAAASAAFGRPEFASLGQLPADTALEVIGSRVESLLMTINDRAFAERVVDARNRAGHSGARIYRRNSVYSGGEGLIYGFQHGGRWEPQLNVAVIAGAHPSGGRDCMRAGIGFNFTRDSGDRHAEEGRARVLAYFAQFQQLVSTEWRGFLSEFLSTVGASVQHGMQPPATTLSPAEAIELLLAPRDPAETEWVFVGRWLFADAPADAATLADARKLLGWIERALTDLLPLWTSVYRVPVA